MRTLLNTQPIEKWEPRSDGALDVHSIFPTIQGEGIFVGVPAVFVRLAGCNLQCPLCDTDYTQGRKLLQVDELLSEIDKVRGAARLIVLTGGEPFRQNTGAFVRSARRAGYSIQVETNGTLYDESLFEAWHMVTVICSPKARIKSELIPRIDALKYVMKADQVDPIDGLPTRALDSSARPGRVPNFGGIIYLQPCDEGDGIKNDLNTRAVVSSCMKFGYRLCVQVHKLVGLP